jgi:hypothetical protein
MNAAASWKEHREMVKRSSPDPSWGTTPGSLKGDASTWIMLAVLLVLAGIVGVGAIALVNFNQMHEVATGSQDTPSSALKK